MSLSKLKCAVSCAQCLFTTHLSPEKQHQRFALELRLSSKLAERVVS